MKRQIKDIKEHIVTPQENYQQILKYLISKRKLAGYLSVAEARAYSLQSIKVLSQNFDLKDD